MKLRTMQVGPVHNPSTVKICTGAVLELSERDHWGTGTLVLQVGPVPPHLKKLPTTLEWMVLVGRKVSSNGVGKPYAACVRVAAIPDAVRDSDWRPAPDAPSEPPVRRTPSGVEGALLELRERRSAVLGLKGAGS